MREDDRTPKRFARLQAAMIPPGISPLPAFPAHGFASRKNLFPGPAESETCFSPPTTAGTWFISVQESGALGRDEVCCKCHPGEGSGQERITSGPKRAI